MALIGSCKGFLRGKATAKPHPPAEHEPTWPMDRVHVDLCGLFQVSSRTGKRYAMIVTDAFSSFATVRCLRSKDEAAEMLVSIIRGWRTTGKVITAVRSDGGGEFKGVFDKFCKEEGSVSSTSSAPDSDREGRRPSRRSRTVHLPFSRYRPAKLSDLEVLRKTLASDALRQGQVRTLRKKDLSLPLQLTIVEDPSLHVLADLATFSLDSLTTAKVCLPSTLFHSSINESVRESFSLHPPLMELRNLRASTAELFLGVEGELTRYFTLNPLARFAMNIVIEAAFDKRASIPVVITALQDLARANWQNEAGLAPLPLSFVLDKLRRAVCLPKDLEVANLRQLVLPKSLPRSRPMCLN